MFRYSALVFLAALSVIVLAAFGIQSSGLAHRLGSGLSILDDFSDNPVSSDPMPIKFTVNRGESTREIADRLQKASIIRSAWYFSSLAQAKGSETSLQAGEYELRSDMLPSEILARFQQGVTRGNRVVVPEGWRVAQIADMLAGEGITTRQAFLDSAGKAQPDPSFGRPFGASAEGYLFPDTYYVPSGVSAADVSAMMVRNFEKKMDPGLRLRAANRKMTIHQIVTLASIVEREAAVASERPAIAGVFYNRLSEGMALQTDPTVQYAAAGVEPPPGIYWKKDLTLEDLKLESPYNTYVKKGLPPGPICNPGLASIRAVLDPASNEYIYFVAKSDGSHMFAKTYEEHLLNVQKQR
jgi:UPF0755 protein